MEEDLFPCKCCGCMLILKITNNFINIACSKRKIIPACKQNNHLKSVMNWNCHCKLNNEEILEQENKLFDKIIEIIKSLFEKSEDCYLKMNTSRLNILLAKLSENKWLFGTLNDSSIGIYYRIFKNTQAYKKALIIHAEKNGMTDEIQEEIKRLSESEGDYDEKRLI